MAKKFKEIELTQVTHEQIARRAYEIYVANGCQNGHAEDDWLQAEYELLRRPVGELVKISERKTSRIPASVKLLIGVVQAAILLPQH